MVDSDLGDRDLMMVERNRLNMFSEEKTSGEVF